VAWLQDEVKREKLPLLRRAGGAKRKA
jgi:hypothetical protein